MDPGVRTHGMKVGSQDISSFTNLNIKLIRSVTGTRTRMRMTGKTTIALLVLRTGELKIFRCHLFFWHNKGWPKFTLQLSLSMTKPINDLCIQRTQINVCICQVWLIFIVRRNNKAHSKTGQTPRLIRVFAGCIGHFLGFAMCPHISEPPHDNTNKMTARPANPQISLGIRPVWSESSMCAWRKFGS